MAARGVEGSVASHHCLTLRTDQTQRHSIMKLSHSGRIWVHCWVYFEKLPVGH